MSSRDNALATACLALLFLPFSMPAGTGTLAVSVQLQPAVVCAGQAATLTIVVTNTAVACTGSGPITSVSGGPFAVSLSASSLPLPLSLLSCSPAPLSMLNYGQSFTTYATVIAPSGPGAGPWPWSVSVAVDGLQSVGPFCCPLCRVPNSQDAKGAERLAAPFVLLPVQAIASSNGVSVEDCSTPTPVIGGDFLKEIGSYPNPFSERTHLGFRLGADATVTLAIYNVAGELIVSDQIQRSAGNHVWVWEGLNRLGSRCASQVCLVHVSAIGRNGQVADYWANVAIAR